jgi:hypothetical protein
MNQLSSILSCLIAYIDEILGIISVDLNIMLQLIYSAFIIKY